MKPPTLGMIVGNRHYFPTHVGEAGRQAMLDVLAEEGIKVVAPTPDETRAGGVENLRDARRCADLFRAHRDRIMGVIVTLPNFGEERMVANVLRWAELGVPVLVHAFPDELTHMGPGQRRDSYWGKISICNSLRQHGITFSLTTLHVVDPHSDSFRDDLRRFIAACRVTSGLRSARIGAIGARPAVFTTMRYSEKLLEHTGISIETLDLSEVIGQAARIEDGDPQLKQKLEQIVAYVPSHNASDEALVKMARLAVVIDRWMVDNELHSTALQCWTALQEFYGVMPCTIMSMMSNNLMPSACETDVAGVIGMYALTLASGRPSALVDWNNNYGDDPDKAVIYHCSNLPKDVFVDQLIAPDDIPVMTHKSNLVQGRQEIYYGTIAGRVRAAPFTYCRVSTDDLRGRVCAYVGEGGVTNDPLATFGGYGVVQVPRLQALLQYICRNGFEHHTAINLSQCAAALEEAFGNYLDWDVYHHC